MPFIANRGVGTAGATGALAPAMLKMLELSLYHLYTTTCCGEIF